ALEDGIAASRRLKQCRDGRFHHFAHGVTRKGIQNEKLRRELVGRKELFAPGAKRWQIKPSTMLQHHSCGDALTPLRIGHADHGTLSNGRMFAECFLNLQRGNLVPTCLDDVNVRPPKDAIDTVLDDRSIAGAKPALAE